MYDEYAVAASGSVQYPDANSGSLKALNIVNTALVTSVGRMMVATSYADCRQVFGDVCWCISRMCAEYRQARVFQFSDIASVRTSPSIVSYSSIALVAIAKISDALHGWMVHGERNGREIKAREQMFEFGLVSVFNIALAQLKQAAHLEGVGGDEDTLISDALDRHLETLSTEKGRLRLQGDGFFYFRDQEREQSE